MSLAVSVLGIQALENFVASVYAYLPNVIAALLIFLVASVVAGAVAGLAMRTMGETTTGKVVATVAPILIMAIAGFMILDQLKIAPAIVTITYAALTGSIALGMALAFGLGGRDVASRLLEGAYAKGTGIEGSSQTGSPASQGAHTGIGRTSARHSREQRGSDPRAELAHSNGPRSPAPGG